MTNTHRLINPVPYRSHYFGEKLHVDQNEKICMFGATHVCAVDGHSGMIVGFVTMPVPVDGHSGMIVGFVTMPVKNNLTIYKELYM